MQPWRLFLVLVPALLGLTGVAQAATYCVMKPACAGTPKPSLQDALDAALLAGADRIEIGSTVGFVPPAGGSYLSSDPLEIVGAGRASTQLGGSTTVLSLGVGSSSSSVIVSDLAIVLQAGSGGTGLRLNGANAQSVDITSESGAAGSTAVELSNGAGYLRGTVSLSATGSVGASARIGTNRIDDVVVDLGNAAAATGVLVGNPSGQTPVILDARHVTIAGGGSSDQQGASASSNASGQTVVLNLTSSIIRVVGRSLSRAAPSGTANVNPTYSNYDPTAILDSGGVGGITSSSTNTNVDPVFVNAPGHDFRLSPASPLIDAAQAGDLEPGEPSVDLAGAKRILDGNGDCVPRRDMGAHELLPGSAAAHASAAPTTVLIGRQITFSASASCDPDPAVALTGYGWSFDDGGSATGAVVQHAFATPGVHSATLTVTSSAGRSGSKAIAVTVTAPPKPATSGAPRKPAKPKPRSLVLIAARPVTLARGGVAEIALKCAGRRRCTGRLELFTARPVTRPASPSARKRVLKLGSSRFSIRGNRKSRVRVRLSSAKVRLVEEAGRLRTNVVVRDRDSAGRPRKSIRAIVLRAPRV